MPHAKFINCCLIFFYSVIEVCPLTGCLKVALLHWHHWWSPPCQGAGWLLVLCRLKAHRATPFINGVRPFIKCTALESQWGPKDSLSNSVSKLQQSNSTVSLGPQQLLQLFPPSLFSWGSDGHPKHPTVGRSCKWWRDLAFYLHPSPPALKQWDPNTLTLSPKENYHEAPSHQVLRA